jgi:hypothetical protein
VKLYTNLENKSKPVVCYKNYFAMLLPVFGTVVFLPLSLIFIRECFDLDWANPMAPFLLIAAICYLMGVFISYLGIFRFPSYICISKEGIHLRYPMKEVIFQWQIMAGIEFKKRMGLKEAYIVTIMGKREGLGTLSKKIREELKNAYEKQKAV